VYHFATKMHQFGTACQKMFYLSQNDTNFTSVTLKTEINENWKIPTGMGLNLIIFERMGHQVQDHLLTGRHLQ